MRETDAWLPDLVPPPGGLARLRDRIRRPRDRIRRPRRQRRATWLLGAAAACAVLALLPGALQRYLASEALAEVVRQAMQPANPGGLRMIDGAAVALESGQAGVRLYLVQPVRKSAAVPQR